MERYERKRVYGTLALSRASGVQVEAQVGSKAVSEKVFRVPGFPPRNFLMEAKMQVLHLITGMRNTGKMIVYAGNIMLLYQGA